jgi:FdhD protein
MMKRGRDEQAGGTIRTAIVRCTVGRPAHAEWDEVAVESPLGVWLDGRPYATLMRTPGEDEALLLGFLLAEGVIEGIGDVVSIEVSGHPEAQECRVSLRQPGSAPSSVRSTLVSSSCGVCGRTSISELLDRMEPIAGMRVDPVQLTGWLGVLGEAQQLFPRTGGVHAAALFTRAGELLDLSEDVGRHNALDKLVGRAMRRGELPMRERVLIMSSRASFDIVQKAALAGVPVVAAMGAASSLAVETARATGIQLCVFLREGGVVEIGSGR